MDAKHSRENATTKGYRRFPTIPIERILQSEAAELLRRESNPSMASSGTYCGTKRWSCSRKRQANLVMVKMTS